MNEQQFLDEFGHIANAPAGVARLRELVLQLAVSGRLVERGISERPISESLSLAITERKQYEETMKLRATRLHPPLASVPYTLPEHWQWVRLEELSLYIQRGKGPSYADHGDVSVISQKCIQWSGFDFRQARFVADDSLGGYGSERYLCDGDLLWNSTGTGTAGRIALFSSSLDERYVADSHVTVIRLSAAAIPRYIWCVIASPWVQRRIQPTHPDSLVSGSTQQVELATTTVRALSIPCPPVEEQARIVAKVDELMALCARLDTQQQDRRKLQNLLRQSSLRAVASARRASEAEDSWRRLQTNFGHLFSQPDDLAGMRGLILDLAVRGMLVEQSDSDGSVDSWLAHVAILKANLIKEKLLSKQTNFVNIPSDDYPFAVPKGWAFVRLGQITNKIGSGSTPRGGREVYVKEGIPFLRSQNVWDDGLRLADVAFIPRQEHERMVGTAVFPKDILLNITGASLGRCALVPTDFGEANVSQHVTIIRPTDPQVREYLHLCLLSPYCQALIWGRQVGMAREGLSKKVLEQFEIPLPPIPEQHRIVERVSELMRLCDEVEDHLRSSLKVAERLAISVVSSLTGIATEQAEEAAMKAPQTELLAPLYLGTPPDVKAQAPLATMLARHNGEMSARDLWQRFGGEIDAFYAQLKTEVTHGWIAEPAVAEVREKSHEVAGP
jgi:type I restriction enzyme S subunit